MKKLMTIGSALLVLSSSAFATQSRLLALGMKETDNDGMYYIQDSRNIFLNSAYLNNYADQLVTEYGSLGFFPAGTTASLNKSEAPKAQGGVFKKYGSMVYGAYYGNESNTSSLLRVAASTTATGAQLLQTADNQLDLFVAGEAGVKWGANLLYASGKNESIGSKDSSIATRFGVIGSNWDANLNLSLASKSERTDSPAGAQEFKGKLGLQVGGSYNVGDGKVFGYYKAYGWDQKLTTGSMAKGDFASYYLGYGRDMTVNGGDKVFASITAKKTDLNVNLTNKAEVRHVVVPLTLGYEAKATEWLTLRGSVIQNIYGQRNNKNVATAGTYTTSLNPVASSLVAATYGSNGKSTIADSTEVNAGASLNFGQTTIDGLIGTTASDGTAASKKGILSGSNLQTTVGLTYKF